MAMDGIIPYVLGGSGGGGGGSSASEVAAMIAGMEVSSVASKAYSQGDYFIYNGSLMVATADIASGGSIVVKPTSGYNCEACTVGEELAEVKGSLNTITPFDTTPKSGSTKGVTSGGMFSALTNKTGSQFLEIPKTDAVESGLCNANFDKATNTVRIYLYVYNETTIIDNHTSLFTIPQGYRPNSGYGLVGVIGKSDGTFLTGFGRVAADGSVFQSTTATAKQCFLMGEYPIA